MDKKDRTLVIEEKSARASEIAKTLKEVSLEKLGMPSLLFPPGTWNAAANATVATSDAATELADAIAVIHSFSFLAISACSSTKMVNGILPSLFSAVHS